MNLDVVYQGCVIVIRNLKLLYISVFQVVTLQKYGEIFEIPKCNFPKCVQASQQTRLFEIFPVLTDMDDIYSGALRQT